MGMHEPTMERRTDWRAVAAGFAVGGLTQAALAVTLLSSHPQDPVLQGAGSFVAVALGGFVAGRLARQRGSWNGVLVAVVFILAAALSRSVAEQQLGRLPGGGALHTGSLIVFDVLQLTGGTLGGWLARRN